MTDIAERVKKVIKESLAKDSVTESSNFIDDLGADSLDVVEIVMDLEEEFGITIEDADAEHIRTVGDAIEFLEKILNT
jgi:acyl carrier protein